MDSNSILNYLSMVSNKNIVVNIMMHFVVITSIVSVYLLKDMKVKKYVFNGAILALVLSVIVNATIYGNPFHAITFALVAIAVGLEFIKGKNQISIPKRGINTVIAFAFILIGLWYPEFVKVNMFASLLLAPTGIVPCPTLLIVIGMLNLYYPNVNKLQFGITVFFGMVYGIIGTFILGVYFDLSLIGIVIYSICNMVINRKTIKVDETLSKI